MSRPRSASNSSRSPCSMNRSGIPRHFRLFVEIPAAFAASRTAEPNPPQTVFSSTVIANPVSSMARKIVVWSIGFAKRALMTPTSSPSSRSRSDAATHVVNSVPKAINIPSSPQRQTSALPNSTGVSARSTFSTLALGYRIDVGPSCESAKSSIGPTSSSSPGAITVIFGKTRMYVLSKTP